MKCKKVEIGFTLIELLVVIAIIALLLAILMPSLGKAKKIAMDVLCRTNVKSMQLATILYTEAYAGRMPEYNFSSGLWINKITVFLSEVDEARYCPRSKRRKELPSGYSFGGAQKNWVWNWEGMPDPEEGSYAMNSWFFSNLDMSDNRYYRNTNMARTPYLVPVFADSIWVDVKPLDTDMCPADFNLAGNNLYGGSMSRLLTYRHEDKTNVGFLDGSQSAVELSELWSLKWHKTFKTKANMLRLDNTPIYRRP